MIRSLFWVLVMAAFPALALAAVLLILLPLGQALAEPPAIPLANVYDKGVHLADYWVSEKFDGVRAYWDGERLVSRNGIATPLVASRKDSSVSVSRSLPRRGRDGRGCAPPRPKSPPKRSPMLAPPVWPGMP